jgi:MtfA peptidase
LRESIITLACTSARCHSGWQFFSKHIFREKTSLSSLVPYALCLVPLLLSCSIMEIIVIILIILAVLTLLVFLSLGRKRNTVAVTALSDSQRQILVDHVDFYNRLDDTRKKEFEDRVQQFLAQVRIVGVKTTVEETDRVLVAASAIIPIFGFSNWEYMNLNEVLLYPDSFNRDFEQQGDDRNTLGMVGSGPFQNVMILSQHELRQGFLNKTGKTNTAIHEFVHLVDKTDGSVDGIPEFLVDRKYILPWLELMHKEIKKIMANRSDINPYGATNEAEFFAVVSEYFFERPDLLESKHPELYELLAKIFRQKTI